LSSPVAAAAVQAAVQAALAALAVIAHLFLQRAAAALRNPRFLLRQAHLTQ
jgi:hypothetical protein